ncbi:hypothetical protein F4779DRAFT_614516 [Xylariaceae sp. FL0662B]|nr:hypothetical protein F4779DRAFT_614516 [Xylariaceae sp. FL0662B]
MPCPEGARPELCQLFFGALGAAATKWEAKTMLGSQPGQVDREESAAAVAQSTSTATPNTDLSSSIHEQAI